MASDLSTMPLIALSVETKEYISKMLNPTKFLSNGNGLQRDWRGLIHLLEVNAELIPWLESQKDPTNYILERIGKMKKDITIKDFQARMKLMDRWDIIDDTQQMFESDAIKYFEQQQRTEVLAYPIQVQMDQEILTFDDAYRLTRGLSTAHYDAFLLYADEDADFANDIMQKLQTEYKLKLCYNQNMIAGLPFEHEAMMKLITERCDKLLVILSPNFLRHPTNQFLLSYTQALSIEKRQRKIVPCIYKNCQNIPYQIKYISRVDYTRRRYQNFWTSLFYSILTPIITSNTTTVEHSNMTQESMEINTLPDACQSDIISITEEIYEEPSRHSLQSENCVMSNRNVDNVKKKKRSFLSKIIERKLKSNRKNLENNQSAESQITDIPHLPSLNDLSSLNSSNIDICKDEKTIKKKSSSDKKRFIKISIKEKIALPAS